MDPLFERTVVAMAHALYMNRLHTLRLTEVVRLGITPEEGTGNLILPNDLDGEMQEQAINYVMTCLPEEFQPAIKAATKTLASPGIKHLRIIFLKESPDVVSFRFHALNSIASRWANRLAPRANNSQ